MFECPDPGLAPGVDLDVPFLSCVPSDLFMLITLLFLNLLNAWVNFNSCFVGPTTLTRAVLW